MIPCGNCGAKLDPNVLACPYCQAPGPAAERLREQEAQASAMRARYAAQYEAQRAAEEEARALRAQEEARASAMLAEQEAQAQQQRLAAGASVTRASNQALAWSLGGLVLCCLPIPSLVALVMASNARRMGTTGGVPVPAQATVATVLSGLSILVFLGFVTSAVLDDRKMAEKKAEEKASLRAQIAAKASAAELDQPTACAMAHLQLLEHGFAGVEGHRIDGFECAGSVSTAPKPVNGSARAMLVDVRFNAGTKSLPIVASACFQGGKSWSLDDLRTDRPCPGFDAPSRKSPVATTTTAAPRGAGVAPSSRDAGMSASGRDAGVRAGATRGVAAKHDGDH